MAQALGWRPRDFWRSTLTEFFAAIEGHNRANGGGAARGPMTRDELDDLKAEFPD